MKNERVERTRTWVRTLIVLLIAAAITWPAAAQETRLVVRGQVADSTGNPLAGYRVVFRVVDQAEVILSTPTEADGEYAVPLPAGRRYVIVAVVSPAGLRVGFDPPLAVPATTGARRDVQLETPAPSVADRDLSFFAGADRLFLSFVEDAAMAARYRFEARFEYADSDAGDLMVSRALAAVQFESLPRLEFGARVGIAGLDRPDGFADESGLTDLDLWAKLHVGPRWLPYADFSVGAVATLPTGQEGTGEGYDAFRSKLFGAMRYRFESFTVSAHAGLRFNEDAEVGGVMLDGRSAGVLGAALLYPVGPDLMLVGEVVWEGKRFAGGEADARLLAGVNWKVLPHGVVRLAVAGGLADGAPDTQFLAGYSIDF